MKGLDATFVAARGDFDVEVSLRVAPGEVVGILGPNGSGKTGLVLALAGLSPINSGHIYSNGRTLDHVATRVHVAAPYRKVGYLPQDALLFPHLSVVDNVAFGLRSQRVSATEARQRATASIDEAGLGALANRGANSLSGGEAQRVALLRALFSDPDILLLDEPTAALDVQARAAVRAELSERVSGFPGPTVLVTHDAVEALTLADRVLVLEKGKVVQQGPIGEVVRRPRNSFVARLAGLTVLSGRADDCRIQLDDGGVLIVSEPASGPVFVTVPPRSVVLHRKMPEGSSRNVWPVWISAVERFGEAVRVSVDGEPSVVADITIAAAAELGAKPGVRLWASVKAVELEAYPA